MTRPPLGHKSPSDWSHRALTNYQRARSSDVTITRADGSVETVTALEMSARRKAAFKARKKARRKVSRTHS